MTVRAAQLGFRLAGRAVPAAQLVVIGGGAGALGAALAGPAGIRAPLAIAAAVLAGGLAVVGPRALLPGLLVWLGALGLGRRLVDSVSGHSSLDVLLLVGPIAVVILTLLAARAGAFRKRGGLANAVLALTAMIVAGALNPLGGSIFGGISGLLFLLVPPLMFWVGRSLVDDRLMRVLFAILASVAGIAAAYGLAQTFVGFPGWDEDWVRTSGYAALNVGGTIRPFGNFSSSGEYVSVLTLGLAILLASTLARKAWALVSLPAFALLAVALFYGSGRGAVFLVMAALGLMIAAKMRARLVLAVALAGLLILVLPAMVQRVAPGGPATGRGSALANHQLEGLANPFDKSASTGGVHASLVVDGITSALRNPVGQGIGAISIAGSKFGGVSKSTEADPSNAAVALGIPGLLGYLAVLLLGVRRVYALARQRRDALSLASLGILIVTLLQWLNGGQYLVALIPWLVLGWADRPAPADPVTALGEHPLPRPRWRLGTPSPVRR